MQFRFIKLILVISVISISCKKKGENMTDASLAETHWDLYFKNSPAFTFYARTDLYIKSDSTFDNYETFDTTYGKWSQNATNVKLNFDNGARYTGSVISADSLSGTLTVAGSNGVWYAKKK